MIDIENEYVESVCARAHVCESAYVRVCAPWLGPNTHVRKYKYNSAKSNTLLFQISIPVQLQIFNSNTNTLPFFYSNTIQIHCHF